MQKVLRKAAQYRKKVAISFSTLVVVLLLGTSKIFAMTNDEIAQFFNKNSSFLQQNGIIYDVFRWLGWMIIKGLKIMADGCQGLYKSTFGLADFTSYSGVTQWISTIQVVCIAILVLSIVVYGAILMIKPEKRNNIIVSVILLGICTSTLAEILITVNDAVSGFCQDITSDSMADDVINTNFYDLLYIDKQYGLASLDVNNKEYLAKCHYPNENFNFDSVNINETINYKSRSLSKDGEALLKKSVTFYQDYTPGGSTGYDLTDVYNGFGWNSGDDADFMNEFYYRYHTNGFQIIIPLIAICIVFVCTSYKTARMFFEMPFKRIYALFQANDITGEQKTLKILGSIRDSYIIIMIGAIDIKLFELAQQFLTEKYDGFTYVMLLVFVAIAVMDGPNIVQAITGEDAGLSSIFGKLVGMSNFTRGLAQDMRMAYQGYMMGKMKRGGSFGKNGKKDKQKENQGKWTTAAASNDDIKNAMDGKNPNANETGGMPEGNEQSEEQENPNNMQESTTNGENQEDAENQKTGTPETGNLDEEQSEIPNDFNESPLSGFDPDANTVNPMNTNQDMEEALSEDEEQPKRGSDSTPKSSYKGKAAFNGANEENGFQGETPEGNMPRNISGETPEGNTPVDMPKSVPEGNVPGSMPRTAPEGNAPGSMPRTAPEENAPGSMPRTAPEGNAPGNMPRSAPEGNAPGNMPRNMPEDKNS
ncbi:MAG: hypothetical protein PUB28_09300 [Roseburia sp.]|nr:hypothetical protein [Roseburia sp.]